MSDTAVNPGGGEKLWAEHQKVFPMRVSGTMRRIKWACVWVGLLVYYLAPFIRWDRGPNAPDQAILIDMDGRRAYFFFIEIWPQEVYYLTGILIMAALALFLTNAVAGRMWCGFWCPQTVWTDLFQFVERTIDGDRRDQIKLQDGPWTLSKVVKRITKHTAWLLIAMVTGGAAVLYFADAPTLLVNLVTGQASSEMYMWVGILTGTTYLLAGTAREQVCVYMCPWPRIQAALTDDEALVVSYRVDRGEPRMSAKRYQAAKLVGAPAGDCVDCYQCVYACPTGVDIRHGMQLGCIQCGLCIDACDTIMTKLNRPTGLIGYDTDKNIERRAHGQKESVRIVRPRTLIYVAVIAFTGLVMLYQLVNRQVFDINVLHDRNPVFVQLSDGGVRNGYTVRLLNKELDTRSFLVGVQGLDGARIEAIGVPDARDGKPLVVVGPDTTRELRVLVFTSPGEPLPSSTDLTFTMTNAETGETVTARDFFKGPGR